MGASSTSSQLAYNERDNTTTTDKGTVDDITSGNKSAESVSDESSSTKTTSGGGTRANIGAQISFKVILNGVPATGGGSC